MRYLYIQKYLKHDCITKSIYVISEQLISPLLFPYYFAVSIIDVRKALFSEIVSRDEYFFEGPKYQNHAFYFTN
jgi:hypothetical protein